MNPDKEKDNVKGKGGIMKLFSPTNWRKKYHRKTGGGSLSPRKSTDKNHMSVQAPISDEDGKENSSISANRAPNQFLKVWTDSFKRQWSIDRKKRKGQTEVNITPKKDEATDKKVKPDDGDERHDGNIQIQNENQKTESVEIVNIDDIEEDTFHCSDDETNQEVDEGNNFNIHAMRRNLGNTVGVEIQDDTEKGKEIWEFKGKLDAECKEVMDHFDEITGCLVASVKLTEHERMAMTVSEEVIDQALLKCSNNAEEEEETGSAQNLTLMTAEELVQDNQHKEGNRTSDEANSTCEENQNRKRSLDLHEDSIKTKDEVAARSVQNVPLFTTEPIENQRHNENEQNMSVTNELRTTNEDSSEREEVADRRLDVTSAVEQYITFLKESSELIKKQIVDSTRSIDLNGDAIKRKDEAAREYIQDVTSFAAESIQNHRHNQNPENEQNMSVTNPLRTANEKNLPRNQSMNISNEDSSKTEEVADRRLDVTSELEQFITSLKESSELIEKQIVDSTRSIDLNSIRIKDEAARESNQNVTSFAAEPIQNQQYNQNPENEQNMTVTSELRNTNKEDKVMNISNEDSVADRRSDVTSVLEQCLTSLKENSKLIEPQIVDNTKELVQNNRCNEIQSIESLTTEDTSTFDAVQDREQLPVLHEDSPNTEQVTESAQNVTSMNEQILAKYINLNYDNIMHLMNHNEWIQATMEITDPHRHLYWEYEEAVSKKAKDGRRATQCIEQEPEVNIPQEDIGSSEEPRNNETSVKEDFRKSCEPEGATLPEAICNMSQEELDEVRNRTVDTVEAYLIPGRINREENECQTEGATLPEAICNMNQEELCEVKNRTVDTVEAYLIPGKITREENECQMKVPLECQADISEVAMLSSEGTQEQEKRTIDYVLELGSSAEDQDFLNKESARIQRAKVYFKNIDAFFRSKNAARSNYEQNDQFLENRARHYRKSVSDFFSQTNM